MLHRVSFVTICLLGAMLLQAGCGSGDDLAVSTEKQTDVFAEDLKNDFIEILTNMKMGRGTDADSVAGLFEFFEENEIPSSDPNQETYDKLRTGAEDLKSMVGKSAPKAEINKKIDELITLAKTLPGELRDLD